MIDQVNFRGAAGQAFSFQRVAADSAWAAEPGLAIFAASDAFGWRVVRIVELTGREHDVQPVWALAEAERYGANAVLVYRETDRDARRALGDDLTAGLDPLLTAEHGRMPMAA